MSVGIFHHNDMDGYAAAAVVAASFGKKIAPPEETNIWFMECNYTNKNISADRIDDECRYPPDEVYIVDLSMKSEEEFEEVYKILALTGVMRVVWIDHHQASKDFYNNVLKKSERFQRAVERNRLHAKIDMRYSGAWLTYSYCFKGNNGRPSAIRLVDDWDTWKHKFPESRSLNSAFYAEPFGTGLKDPNSIEWRKLIGGYLSIEDYNLLPHKTGYPSGRPIYCPKLPADHNLLKKYIERGKIINQYKQTTYDAYFRANGYVTEFEGYRTMVLNYKANSEVFSEFYDECPLHLIWVFDGVQYKYSIYSETIDCNEIAKKYGGGGHKGAAGFTSNELLVPTGDKYFL